MSQPTYLKNLKAHARQQFDGAAIDPKVAVSNLVGESDRGAVILAATSIEDMLEWAILRRLPNLLLDSDARDEIFGLRGSLGTFSSKIQMAYAMAVIDKAALREINIVREMRNVCAHARLPTSFKDKALSEAAKQVIPEILPHVVHNAEGLRHAFVIKCTFICQYIITGVRPDIIAALREGIKRRPSEGQAS